MSERAFSRLAIPGPAPKPRDAGMTMMSDLGVGLTVQKDILEMSADYLDLAKLATTVGATLPEEPLKQKIGLYKSYGVEPFNGGYLLEYAIFHHGMDIVPYYFEENKRLDLDVVEVSDNNLSISLEEKCRLVTMGASEYGLKILAESGAETEKTDPKVLLEDIEACLDAGAWKVLVEANELVTRDGAFNMEMIDMILDRVDLSSLMFEIPWVWLDKVHWYQSFKALYALTEQFGAPVNIGNVDRSLLVWLELLRNGSSRRVG